MNESATTTSQHTQLPANVITPLGITAQGKQTNLLYRSKRRGHNKLGLAISDDSISFEEIDSPVLMFDNGQTENIDQIERAHLSQVIDQQVLTYSKSGKLKVAIANELSELGIETWNVAKSGTPSAEAGIIVPEFKHNGQYVMYHSRNNLSVSLSRDLKRWHGPHDAPIHLRRHNFDRKNLVVLAAQVVQQGIMVIYQSTEFHKQTHTLSIGAVLFNRMNPNEVIWQASGPLWQVQTSRRNATRTIGALIYQQDIIIYCTSKSGGIFIINLPNPHALETAQVAQSLALSRHPANPIIAPEGGGPWEAIGTFNPAVLHDAGKIHILYRALDAAGVSYIGYASSKDGVTIDERHPTPAYWPRMSFEAGTGIKKSDKWSESFGSGGGWGGCEDPKVTRIGDTVYLTYVAHDGWSPPRLAMSTISRSDFLDHKWDNWSEPRLISEPNVTNKSGIILPEQINGKYVIFHRVYPNILIHYTDDLDKLGRSEWLASHASIASRPHNWDSRKLSIGATPLRIDEGWLVIYHAVDDRDDGKYKIGAMILDANNPSKVIARSNNPILEPEMPYENEWKFGIAYPSGAAILDGVLHVYYGGGDRHVCVATAPLKRFVENLLNHKDSYLENPKTAS